MPGFSFTVEARDGRARAGRLTTPHGEVETPVFMPVGTAGAVKAILHRDLREIGARVLLANTYHLMLRPGDALVAGLGGLHGFTGWDGPFLTDSGGYQVFSLAALRKVGEEGVRFQSHLDGTAYLLSPERSWR
jgi:queuine tRNA-ribosyltransferase